MSQLLPQCRPRSTVARRIRSWVRMLALVLMAGLVASPSFAQGRPPPRRTPTTQQPAVPVSGKVNVEIMVVHGTNAHERIDPAVKPVLQSLKFLSYSGFEMLSKQDHDIAVGRDHTFQLEGDRRVTVDVVFRDERQAKLRLRLYNGASRIMDTTITVHRNKSFMVAGPPFKDGVLILPVTARY